MKKKKYYWWIHHDKIVEQLTEPARNRRIYIKYNKAGRQVDDRLACFQPVRHPRIVERVLGEKECSCTVCLKRPGWEELFQLFKREYPQNAKLISKTRRMLRCTI